VSRNHTNNIDRNYGIKEINDQIKKESWPLQILLRLEINKTKSSLESKNVYNEFLWFTSLSLFGRDDFLHYDLKFIDYSLII
jgi:hypothetical protein